MKILDRKSFNAFFSQSRSRRNRKRASAGSAGMLGCPAQRKLPTTGSNTAEKKPEKENTKHKQWIKKKSATSRYNPSSSFP